MTIGLVAEILLNPCITLEFKLILFKSIGLCNHLLVTGTYVYLQVSDYIDLDALEQDKHPLLIFLHLFCFQYFPVISLRVSKWDFFTFLQLYFTKYFLLLRYFIFVLSPSRVKMGFFLSFSISFYCLTLFIQVVFIYKVTLWLIKGFNF